MLKNRYCLRRWLTLGLLVLLLAGCSRNTLVTVRADLISFAAADEIQGELSVANGTFHIPDEDGFSASRLGETNGALDALQSLSARIEVALESEGLPGSAQVSLDVHLAPDDDSDLFATPPVATAQATLTPGESGSLLAELVIDESVNSEELDEIQDGDFRIGARLTVSGLGGGTIHYLVEEALLSVTAQPGDLLPF